MGWKCHSSIFKNLHLSRCVLQNGLPAFFLFFSFFFFLLSICEIPPLFCKTCHLLFFSSALCNLQYAYNLGPGLLGTSICILTQNQPIGSPRPSQHESTLPIWAMRGRIASTWQEIPSDYSCSPAGWDLAGGSGCLRLERSRPEGNQQREGHSPAGILSPGVPRGAEKSWSVFR